MTLPGKTLRRISWRDGLESGLRTAWSLGIVIFPITLAFSILRYTPIFDVLLSGLTPVMGLFGLPGEAAVPLLLGNFLNLYAAIGAILALDLTVKQVFILALMLSFSHGLPVESAVCKRVGVSATLVTGFRIALALVAGVVVNLLWSGGGETARYGFAAPNMAQPEGWTEIVTSALASATTGVVQIAVIVIVVMMFIQILKDLGALDIFARATPPLLKPLGISSRGSVTMAGGLTFGLAFGAGVILEQAREKKFTKREITLIALFLSACHAVIEDTLIFIPLGIPVLPLLLIRLTTAIALTVVIARLCASRTEASFRRRPHLSRRSSISPVHPSRGETMSEMQDFNRRIISEFRENGGEVGPPFENSRIVLLTMTGAKSSRERTTPLVYMPDGDRVVIFASKAGAPTNPAWYHNLKANPDVTIEVGTEKYEATATEIKGEERDELYAKQAAKFPTFAEYQEKTDRIIPVIALERK